MSSNIWFNNYAKLNEIIPKKLNACHFKCNLSDLFIGFHLEDAIECDVLRHKFRIIDPLYYCILKVNYYNVIKRYLL